MEDLRVGAVVMRSVLGETSENLNRTSAWVRKAASEGVDLVCFPESNLTGYSVREVARSVAEPVAGPLGEAVVQMARENRVVILASRAFIANVTSARLNSSFILPGTPSLCSMSRTQPSA